MPVMPELGSEPRQFHPRGHALPSGYAAPGPYQRHISQSTELVVEINYPQPLIIRQGGIRN